MKSRPVISMMMITLLIPSIALIWASISYFSLEDSYWSSPLVLGATNNFTVKLKSLYSGPIEDISATLTIHDVAGSDYTGTYSYSGPIFKGQALLMNFPVYVPDNADGSHYRATLEVSFLADGTPETQTFDLAVTVRGTPQVRCSLSAYAKPGWPVTAQLTLMNYGDGVARRVRAVITPASPNVQVSSPVEAGMMNPGEVRTFPVTMYIGDTADESVSLSVSVTWESQIGTVGQYTCIQNVAISEMPPEGLRVFTNTTELEPGKDNRIYLFIENRGENVFRSSLTLQPPPGTAIKGSNRFDTGNLSSEKAVCVSLDLYIDPSIRGPLQVSTTLTWYDSGSELHSNTVMLGFYVKVMPGPFLVAYTDNKVLTPGSEDMVDLILRNEGQEAARSVRVNFIPSKDLAVLSPSGVEVGDLEPGKGARITVLLSTPNVSYGGLALTLQTSYIDEHDRMREQLIPLSFITESPETPLISISSLDKELVIDEVNQVHVNVRNEGGIARNVVIKLALPSPELGAVVGSDYALIEQLDKRESATRSFSVYLSPQAYGAVQFLVQVKYEDKIGIPHQDLLSFGARVVGKPKIEVAHVSTVPLSIYPGDTNVKLMVVVINVGNYVAKELRLNLSPVRGIISPSSPGADTFLIPALPPNQATEVTFLIDVDENARPGRYEAQLISKLGNVTLPIQVGEKARFKLTKFSIPGKPKPGDRGVKLTVMLENEAKVTAKDMVLEVITPYLVGTTSAALGEIPPKSEASVIMEVDIDKNAPLRVPVNVKISWKQEDRSLYQVIHTEIRLEEARGEAWSGDYVGLAIMGIIAIVLVLVLLFIKKFISGGFWPSRILPKPSLPSQLSRAPDRLECSPSQTIPGTP